MATSRRTGRGAAPTGRPRGPWRARAAGRAASACSCSTISASASSSERSASASPCATSRYRSVPVSATTRGRRGRCRVHASIAARLRRACSAIISAAASRPSPVTGASGVCSRLRYAGASSRAHREAVRQLPLLAPAPNGVTRTSGVGVGTDIGNGGARATRRSPRSAGEIAAALVDAREYTLGVYAHLDAAQEHFPRLREVNPPRWEIGHIGWFQEFWCRRYRPDDPAGARTPPRLPEADRWWDSRHVPHDTRWDLPLPDWDRIRAFLAVTLDDALARLPDAPDRYFHELALYHEDMHGEALLMTLQSLALPAPPWWRSPDAAAAAAAVDIELDGGPCAMGSSSMDARSRFVFDNEQWSHEVALAPFAIASRPVTQGEFAAFVDAGGYARRCLLGDRCARVARPCRTHAAGVLAAGGRRFRVARVRRVATDRSACADVPRLCLRGRGVVRLGRPAPSHRGGVGACGPRRRHCRSVRRLGVDGHAHSDRTRVSRPDPTRSIPRRGSATTG